MSPILRPGDTVGLLHPFVDAHTLGISVVGQLLEDCGFRSVIAGETVCRAAEHPDDPSAIRELEDWSRANDIKHVGFSYRLDPESAAKTFEKLVFVLRDRRLLEESGGSIRGLYFAGLPAACQRVGAIFGDRVRTFIGDETPQETLAKLGVPSSSIPTGIREGERYEQDRLNFGRQVLERELPDRVLRVNRGGYSEFGTSKDSLTARLDHGWAYGLPPLMRAHVGPFRANREAAVAEFVDWSRRLASSGYLDILSIGTSQLTQSRFGEEWDDAANGGGVPIRTEEEYRQVYQASRPMLVRTYAGTKDIPKLAEVHERALNIAWHALSFWWFSKIDGRGPNPVAQNLAEHFETMGVIARSGKPMEANIPHHFAFRGADDATYVVSGVLAARCAKAMGIRTYVLQNMLNTPRSTSGIQDLVKARVLLSLVRELQDKSFRVVYQPRAGLDYFSPNEAKAKVQLAAVTALMDDVEPRAARSPDVIHVVSYSEGYALADPVVVDESIRITRAALEEYRQLRARGRAPVPSEYGDVDRRTAALTDEVRRILATMEAAVPNLYSPQGLYRAFWAGFLPVPHLWECRDEFENAIAWRTRPIEGAMRVVDEHNRPIPLNERLRIASENARRAVLFPQSMKNKENP